MKVRSKSSAYLHVSLAAAIRKLKLKLKRCQIARQGEHKIETEC